MRAKQVPKKTYISVLYFLVVASLAIYAIHSYSIKTAHAVGEIVATAEATPEYITFLKKQAEERKVFYESQSQAIKALKIKHAEDHQEMLERHRKARTQFANETHTVLDRHSFFTAQRDEMGELKTRQRQERKDLDIELKQKLSDFHLKQKQEKSEWKAAQKQL